MIPNESLRSAVKASKSGLGCHFPFPRCYAIYTVGDGCEKKQKEVNELSFEPRCPTQEQRASRSVPEGAGRWCEAKPKSTSPRPDPSLSQQSQSNLHKPASQRCSVVCLPRRQKSSGKANKKEAEPDPIRSEPSAHAPRPADAACLPGAKKKTRLPVPSLPENPLHLPSPFRSRSCDPLTTSPPQTKQNRESIP